MSEIRPRIWELKHEGNQHHDWVKASLLNGDGGWNDILMPDGPVKAVELAPVLKMIDSAIHMLEFCSIQNVSTRERVFESARVANELKSFLAQIEKEK
jgi:hypothetical protein